MGNFLVRLSESPRDSNALQSVLSHPGNNSITWNTTATFPNVTSTSPIRWAHDPTSITITTTTAVPTPNSTLSARSCNLRNCSDSQASYEMSLRGDVFGVNPFLYADKSFLHINSSHLPEPRNTYFDALSHNITVDPCKKTNDALAVLWDIYHQKTNVPESLRKTMVTFFQWLNKHDPYVLGCMTHVDESLIYHYQGAYFMELGFFHAAHNLVGNALAECDKIPSTKQQKTVTWIEVGVRGNLPEEVDGFKDLLGKCEPRTDTHVDNAVR
ncbi:unnamed protein product [Periconia digitata]|uniref:Uncharacterized protein n=1 Tax=Periconia digitata TaxID=1303443 RepID=A0A9W4UCV0_9PLEO|nr:unnamed protein product [Periconia digitata]